MQSIQGRSPTPAPDHVGVAIRYARQALRDTGRERHGIWLQRAAQRFLTDLQRIDQGVAPFTFNPARANEACEFIEELPHVEGTWGSETIVLHPAQVFFLVQLFGFRDERGGRRFTSALLAIARKNAKSTLAAAILIYCICCEPELGPQLITAATTGSQARVVFNIIRRMVVKTPDLAEQFGLMPFANAVARPTIGGSIKPINAKASTQDGLNPSHTELDEIHAHKTHDLLNVLQSAAGARDNPLWLYTTTEGYETPGPWPELRNFAQRLLERVFVADHFLVVIWSLDDDDEDYDERRWVKANPLIDTNPVLAREVKKAAIEAKQMPGQAAEFRIKRLNRRSAAAKSWVNLDHWRACSGAVPLERLKNVPCWGAIDLASTTDLCSLRLLWELQGRYYTHGWRWVPEAAVSQRTERGTVPYAAWVESGLIKQTPGEVADYAIIERDIDEIKTQFPLLRELSFDPWNATDLVNRLMEKSYTMVAFRQGPKSYHPAMQFLERLYVKHLLHHGGDPVLLWCAANLVPRFDENLNMAPDKKRSADKIDDVTALLMCAGRAAAFPPSGGFEGWLTSAPVVVG